jgi:hypothetical protein
MYLLRSLTSECDTLVIPGGAENSAMADLHNMLKEHYPVYREAVCVDKFVKLNNEETYVPIVRNSVSSLLLPSSEDFLWYVSTYSIFDCSTFLTLTKILLSEIDISEKNGLFSCVICYFVLGGSSTETSDRSESPSITKMRLSRDKILRIERTLSECRSRLSESYIRRSHSLRNEAAGLLKMTMIDILQSFESFGDDVPRVTVSETNSDEPPIINIDFGGKVSSKLTVKDESVLFLLKIFSLTTECTKDLINHELYSIFRNVTSYLR